MKKEQKKIENYRVTTYEVGLASELHMDMLAGVEQCIPGNRVGPSIRGGYHLHAVIAGTGTIRIGEWEGTVHAGQLFLLVPGIETEYIADEEDPWYYCWITFGGTLARKYVEFAGFSDGVFVQDSMVNMTEYLEIVTSMLEHPHQNHSSLMYNMGRVYEFLSIAVKSQEIMNQGKNKSSLLTKDNYVDYVVKYIAQNYANTRIAEVADYIGVSRHYLSRIFKQKMCVSPQEYLMQIRMDKARELLLQTELSVLVIAKSVGYEDPLTFSKIFKKRYELSPENFRNENRTK